MMKLIPLPAFADNDRWMLHDGAKALVVDPVDAAAARAALVAQGLELPTILVTHRHAEPPSRVAAACDRKKTRSHRHPSLGRVAALPPDTPLGFTAGAGLSSPQGAAVVEPGNRDIGARMDWRAASRAQRRPGLPSTIVDALRD
jgi:hypothetical protein